MKQFIMASLMIASNAFAASSPVASYFSQNNQNWELVAEVTTHQGKLAVTFVAGCSAYLKNEVGGVYSASCQVGQGHRSLLYIANLKPQGNQYTLTFQVIDFSHADGGSARTIIAYPR